MKRLAVFGSGAGTNTENICNYFSDSTSVKVACICTNNKGAFIVKRAKKLKPDIIFTDQAIGQFSVQIL